MNEYKILELILEDYDFDNEAILINEILLNEENPINIIDNKLNNEEVKESNKTSEEINDLLDFDKIKDDAISNNNNDIEKDNDNKLIKVDIYPDDDFDEEDESIEELNITLKDIDNNTSELLKVNVEKDDNNGEEDNADKKIDLKISAQNNNDDKNSTINLNINNNIKTKDTIELKLKNNNKDDRDVKLKVVDTSTANSTGAPGEIFLKLKSYDGELDDKTSEFIKKRDELLQNNNPNFQLSTTLKIIVQLKESLERLIIHLPDETVLARTKFLLGNMLDSIMDNSTSILKDKEKLKEIIYKIFSTLISVNEYVTNKYNELEDNLDKNKKKNEDISIKSSIKKAEEKTIIDDKNENNSSSENNNITDDNKSKNKVPNINKKKI